MFLLVQRTRYKVPGTRYKVHEISSDMKSRRTWNLKWHQISTPPHIYLNFFGILSFVTQVNSLPRTSSKPNKSECCLSIIMSIVMNCWCSWNVKCRMLNVECSLFTTVHYCSQLFTNIHCSQLCTTNCSMFTVHNCSQMFETMYNCPQLCTVHIWSQFTYVHNCSPFTTDCSQLCTVCLFLKDRCTN